MKPKNYNKGITLIALVITIIVLLILAGVTINIVINKGIIDKTQTTVDEYKISDYKERIELIKTGEQFKKLNNESEDSLKNLVVKKLRERENENWVKEVETSEEDAALEENQIKVITQDKYIIIAKIEENGKITYLPIEKDDGEPYPSLELEVLPLEGTENEKIKIKVIATVEKIGKTKKVEEIILENTGERKKYIEDGVIFEVEEDGIYKFKAITDQGKNRSKKIEIISKITINAEPKTSRNTESAGTQNGVETGPITVTITYGKNNYTKQYKVGNENWQTATETIKTINVTENTTIVARYYDGTNGFETEKYNVQNVDNVAPTFTDYDVTLSGTTITATGTAIDTASEGAASKIEGIEKYQYSKDGTNYQDENTFNITTAGNYTIYIKAIDKAGNERVVNKTVIIGAEVNSYYKTYVTTYSSEVNTTTYTSTSYSTTRSIYSYFVSSTTSVSYWSSTWTNWITSMSGTRTLWVKPSVTGTGGESTYTYPVYYTKTSTKTSTFYPTSKKTETTYYTSTTSSLTDKKTTYYISK